MHFEQPLYLVAAGHAHPDTELTSAELEAHFPRVKHGWSERYLEMSSRRVLGIHERASTLAIDSLHKTLDDVGWEASSLDAIICGCSMVDQIAPATAACIANSINQQVIAFDVNAVCASFPYAVAAAAGLLETIESVNRVAVCVAEHASAWADYTDEHSSIYWGDAAGNVLITTEAPNRGAFQIVDMELVGDQREPNKVFASRHGTFRQDGRYSYEAVIRLSSAMSSAMMERHGLVSEDITVLVGHQSGGRLLRDISKATGIPYERQWHNFEWAGNQSAAGVLTAFSEGWEKNAAQLADGDHVMMAAVGGGYAGGALLLRWQQHDGS